MKVDFDNFPDDSGGGYAIIESLFFVSRNPGRCGGVKSSVSLLAQLPAERGVGNAMRFGLIFHGSEEFRFLNLIQHLLKQGGVESRIDDNPIGPGLAVPGVLPDEQVLCGIMSVYPDQELGRLEDSGLEAVYVWVDGQEIIIQMSLLYGTGEEGFNVYSPTMLLRDLLARVGVETHQEDKGEETRVYLGA